MQLTYKFRLRDKHAAELNRQARAVNYVWNYCNETQQKAVRDGRKWLAFDDLRSLTVGSSKLLGLHGHTIQGVCQQYDRSRSSKRRPWLKWRGPKSLGWIPFNTGKVSFDGETFKFRGVRYETMHMRDLPPGVKIAAGSFNQDSRGLWYISIPVNVEASERKATTHVGIDLGLKDLATLSDGRKIEAPRFYCKSETALATAHRARKTRRARAIHAKIARRRKDFAHKLSAQLTKEYGLIVIGDVNPERLSQTHLAKSVFDAGWSDLKRCLAYKSKRNGGITLEVSERMTTQTCSECGALPASRPKGIAGLGIREWTCSDCGAIHDRDVNAAVNILRVGQYTLAEGARSARELSKKPKLELHKMIFDTHAMFRNLCPSYSRSLDMSKEEMLEITEGHLQGQIKASQGKIPHWTYAGPVHVQGLRELRDALKAEISNLQGIA